MEKEEFSIGLTDVSGSRDGLSKARKELRESIIAIAPIFAEKPFFMNDELSLVDCCVAPILWRLKEVDIALPERSTKALHHYMQSMFERDAFRASLTEAEMEMREETTPPYLLRALTTGLSTAEKCQIFWWTPKWMMVVPQEHVRDGQIVLNIRPKRLEI